MAKVKVTIAVVVDPKGAWGSAGWDSDKAEDRSEMQNLAAENVEQGEAHYWLTAELDIPTIQVVEANALPADVERYRDALNAIIVRADQRLGSKVSDDVVAIARAALTNSEEQS